MKRCPSPKSARHAKASAKPRGRYGRVWLSPEFVTWCKKHHLKPEGFGRCVLHTFVVEHPEAKIIIRGDGHPVSVDDIYDIYDLPSDGKETI